MTVKQCMKKFLVETGLKLNLDIRISQKTPKALLSEFLASLYPIKTDLQLIRMGSNKDGGYLVLNDLEGIDALISPGVGNKQDFDLDCAMLGMNVYMADNSVTGPKIKHENFFFIKKHIATIDDDNNITMETWLNGLGINPESDLLLQMDIEGDEYDIIRSIKSETISRFRIIIIEFHNLDMLWCKNYFGKITASFDRILKTHYVAHIHPNNCCKPYKCGAIEIPPVMEMTFIRKDRVVPMGYATEFPHRLDVDCTTDSSVTLPQCFYASKKAI